MITARYERGKMNAQGRKTNYDLEFKHTIYGFEDRADADAVNPPFRKDGAKVLDQPRPINTRHEIIGHGHKDLDDTPRPTTVENCRSDSIAEEHRAVEAYNSHNNTHIPYRHPYYLRHRDGIMQPTLPVAPLIDDI